MTVITQATEAEASPSSKVLFPRPSAFFRGLFLIHQIWAWVSISHALGERGYR